ncbi:MAG: TldD/PmbA family protein [Candidatus Odinarchaeota archaeon]
MEDLAEAALDAALEKGASFADIRVESSVGTKIELTGGVTKKCQSSRIKGAGIRAFIDGSWGFTTTSSLKATDLKKAGETAARIAMILKNHATEKFSIVAPTYEAKVPFRAKQPLVETSVEEKVQFVQVIDKQARAVDDRIINTRTVYNDFFSTLYIANTLGTAVWIEHSLPRIYCRATAKECGKSRDSHESAGFRGGFERIKDEGREIGTRAAKLAIEQLSATTVKGKLYDVILDPKLNGTLVHESFGHACEADNFRAGSSILIGKNGQQLGIEELNILDDPTLPNLRGSFDYDWEGTRTRKKTLIEKGILGEMDNKLHSLETASFFKIKPNGSARAESFLHHPIPRMSNTFMKPGSWNVDELISDMREGLILCDTNYGYTNSAKGQFMFQASYGYLIENGEKGKPLTGVSVSGMLLDVLMKIDGIASDFDMMSGTCGKDGQEVEDYSGGPHIRVRNMPVGGM